MKKNAIYLALGLMVMGLFASCNKEGVVTGNANQPEVPEGKILLNAGYQAPQGDAKYTFNIDLIKCFFNSDDSVYINGTAYAVFPYGDGIIETDTASSYARIWADVSADNQYKGLYPKDAFTSSITDVDNPTVFVPARVKGIPTGPFIPTNTRIVASNDGRIMPTTAYTTTLGTTDSLIFRNTVSLIITSLKYNYAFGAAIDPDASVYGYPSLIIDSIRITTTSGVLSGSGVIQNPYTTNPILVLNNTGSNTITYTLADTTNRVGPTPRNPQDIAFLPIVSGLNTTANLEIFFTAKLRNGNGETRHYVYSKTSSNPLTTQRNKILIITVPFSTAADFNNYVTLVP